MICSYLHSSSWRQKKGVAVFLKENIPQFVARKIVIGVKKQQAGFYTFVNSERCTNGSKFAL